MTRESQRTAKSLTQLSDALRATITDLEELVRRSEHLRSEVDSGMPLADAMASEVRPLIITKLVEITDRLHEAGGAVRRAEAHQLRAEGCTQERIAEIFGVSRQRAAMLLKNTAVKPPAKRSHRP